jgi:hypothetical protein
MLVYKKYMKMLYLQFIREYIQIGGNTIIRLIKEKNQVVKENK